jgi:hypothetical protein
LFIVGAKQESASFWKKKQRLFAHLRTRRGNAYAIRQKFFGSFFQKRTAFFLP